MIRRSVFTLFCMVWGTVLPANTVLSATPEKTKELLQKYPKENISLIKENNDCPAQFVLDSCYSLNWSGSDSSWIRSRGSFYTYDMAGKLLVAESRYAAGTAWLPGNRILYIYDTQDKLTIQLYLSFNSGNQRWDTIQRYLRDYSATGYLLTTTVQHFSQGTWTDKTLYSYAYNDAGKRVRYCVSYRAPSDTGWIPQYRFLYTWEGALQTENIRQNYDTASGTWLNDSRESYSFDPQDRLITTTISKWDTVSEDWINSSSIRYDYDHRDRLVLQLYQSWANGHWEDAVRYLYSYDRPDTTIILFQVWNASDSLWHDDYRYIYGYDACGNLTSETGMTWDNTSGGWVNDYRVRYFVSPLPWERPLEVKIIDSSNISCYGYDNGWAVATASGGTPPYTWLWDNNPPSTDSVATGLAPWRWYHVTVTDSLGNTATDSVFLTEPEPVSTGRIRGPVMVSPGRYYCYFVVPPQEGYYLWTALGGKIPGHPTGPHAVVKWTRPGTDTLLVVRYSMNGCPGDTAILVVNALTTSVPETGDAPVTVWPNPVSDLLHITTVTATPFRFRITGLSGRPVKTGRTGAGRDHVISVADITPGIYLLKIYMPVAHVVVKKIIVR